MSATDRLDLYRYTVAENRDEYLALMGLFTASLLTDLSASEAQAALAEVGVLLTVDEVAARCDQLETWGNLVRSLRDSRVATVAEFLRSRSRYQVSKLGGRVHRTVEDLLATSDGAREVARELLGGIADTLARIDARLDSADNDIDVDALASDVTTVFNNQQLFSESVKDFYAYLQQVLSRYDLVGTEYATFKQLLLDYVDLISADVAHHAPAVSAGLTRVNARRQRLLAHLGTLPSLAPLTGTVERLPGRVDADWDQITAWYDTTGGDRSGPDQLRSAARHALSQLLANAKRMLAASGTGVSRRSDLLRLAAVLHTVDAGTAHRLFNAAFGAYPSRHLLLGPDQLDPRITVADSWWTTTGVEVPVALRERGDRAAIGRTAPVPDPAAERARVEADAARTAAAAQAAVAELAAAGDLQGTTLTPAARDLVLTQLAALLAGLDDGITAATTHLDASLGVALTVAPSATDTVITASDGDLVLHGLVVYAHIGTGLDAGDDLALREGTA